MNEKICSYVESVRNQKIIIDIFTDLDSKCLDDIIYVVDQTIQNKAFLLTPESFVRLVEKAIDIADVPEIVKQKLVIAEIGNNEITLKLAKEFGISFEKAVISYLVFGK